MIAASVPFFTWPDLSLPRHLAPGFPDRGIQSDLVCVLGAASGPGALS